MRSGTRRTELGPTPPLLSLCGRFCGGFRVRRCIAWFCRQWKYHLGTMSLRKGDRKKTAPKHKNSFAFKHNKNSKKSAKIMALPNVGLCTRCFDKIEWRKKYRKYKPLKAPRKWCVHIGTVICCACFTLCCGCLLRSVTCHNKSVKHAYHVICQACAEVGVAHRSVRAIASCLTAVCCAEIEGLRQVPVERPRAQRVRSPHALWRRCIG